ncbi:3'(2'),5'-bisphosphate nucleotidase CysQ [Sulfidibacter corallicola]|uniref:3'(2'),5'-bisphosphate nucleotidase CysQ n=1 Tax=Sulfidibacter corallicola TaxID=2818388 RepID=A0A8A4TWH4_SULCO|nr:3'(2'),5'-bisphosphate nucleotidase CysQ [Sulfidibacter corallicola]QTD53528.1 3'(2'),5'-bisphosphate nucleotidase CysQ [Sulfidibacter corallicola]
MLPTVCDLEEPYRRFMEPAYRIAIEAGGLILEVYDDDHQVSYKDDRSPITRADRASHHHITQALQASFPDIPVLSEEAELPDFQVRRDYSRFWLIDPLDGTREFVNRNDEFTVNIALIEGTRAVLGVVHVPVSGQTFFGAAGQGAWLAERDGTARRLACVRPTSERALRIGVSRSHPDPRLTEFLNHLDAPQSVPLGSSLKFCRIAEGQVDLYPRMHPLREWDVAAAQVITEEAGGVVWDWQARPLTYNKEVMKHDGGFLAAAGSGLAERILAGSR